MQQKIIFITGMSGVGKTTVLKELEKRGYATIETDNAPYSVLVETQDEREWRWDEQIITKTFNECQKEVLFLTGTVANQGKFYSHFKEVVYLKAPLDVLLKRVDQRLDNPYGKTEQEKEEIKMNHQLFESLIEKGASKVIETTQELQKVVDEIEALVHI